MRDFEASAKTQDDLVASRMPATEEYQTEELTFPSIKLLHTMRDTEIEEFFCSVLKARQNISEVVFKFGDYKTTEVRMNFPRSNALHSISFGDVAHILTSTLGYNNKTIGFKAVVIRETDNVASKVFALVAEKIPVSPQVADDGTVIKEGDKEFNPSLTVSYKLS